MSFFAYIGIFDALLKLGVAFLLITSSFDKLILYSLLLFIVSVFVRIIYTFVCKKEFEECRKVKIGIDHELFSGLLSFAGWNIFGAGSTFCRGQGINILFNLFGGPVVNAAYGIANQVNTAVTGFVSNFTTALNPSIIKSYAAHEKEYMMSLVYQGARFSYFLVLLFAMPLILEAEYITKIWLGQTPEFSVVFIQLMLVYSLIDSLSKTIMAGVHASGKIKVYQIVVGSFQIILLPVAYLLLRLGYSQVAVFVSMIIIDVIAVFARMLMAKGIFGLSISAYLNQVILRVTIVTVVASIIPVFLRVYMDNLIWRLIVVVIVSIITTGFSVLFIGCTKTERKRIVNKSLKFIHR